MSSKRFSVPLEECPTCQSSNKLQRYMTKSKFPYWCGDKWHDAEASPAPQPEGTSTGLLCGVERYEGVMAISCDLIRGHSGLHASTQQWAADYPTQTEAPTPRCPSCKSSYKWTDTDEDKVCCGDSWHEPPGPPAGAREPQCPNCHIPMLDNTAFYLCGSCSKRWVPVSLTVPAQWKELTDYPPAQAERKSSGINGCKRKAGDIHL